MKEIPTKLMNLKTNVNKFKNSIGKLVINVKQLFKQFKNELKKQLQKLGKNK
jgi:hypothetical protein